MGIKTDMLDKKLLVDVFDAYLYDDNDNLIFMSKNLTSTDITGGSDETEVRNGKGNGLFAKLYSNKKVDVSLKTNVFNFSTLALLCGTEIGTGEGTYYSEDILKTVKNGQVILPEIPKYPEKVTAYIENEKVTTSIEGQILTVDNDYEGKDIEIMPYEYESDDDEIQEITIRADEFPPACKLVLKSYTKTKKSKIYKNLTIVIPQASVSSDFTLSSSSEIKPSETEIKLSALTDNGKLMRVIETPFTKDEDIVLVLGNIEWAKEPISYVAKDTDGTGNPPYQLFKINYNRKGALNSVRCEVSDKDTGELYYAETNTTKLTEGQGSFIYSLRKGLADYDTMSQDQKDAVERTNDTQLPKGTEIVIKLIMTDTNGDTKTLTKNYLVTAKDVKEGKFV